MYKRLICGILTIALFFACIPISQANADAEVTLGTITGSNVAMRKSASKDGAVLERLRKGAIVTVLQTNVNAEWYQVEYKSVKGYVNRVYVNIDLSLPAYDADMIGTVANCRKEVNVRATPSATGTLLGTAEKGNTYEVFACNVEDGWCAVNYNGKTGYISQEYLSITADAPEGQLSSLTVTGGVLSPSFAPGEYGYVLVANQEEITITAAGGGSKVNVDSTGRSSITCSVKEGNSRTVRIKVDGKTKYSIYIVRGALIVGTWNIKRGYENLVNQGRVIETQQADLLGLQEVYRSLKTKAIVDNIASLRTKELQYSAFAPTVAYDSGGEYGIGSLSRYEILSAKIYPLTSADKEPRVLLKIVVQVEGTKISFYNTHFSYDSASIRSRQFREVVDIMDKDENAHRILVGDFNAKISEFSKLKGYQVINDTDTKFYDYDGTTVKKTVIDNIIVSDNFTVLNIRMLDVAYSDHKPIFAFLRIDGN